MLLRKAVQYQTQIKMDACCGLGWDRHLIGLFYCCQEMKMTPPTLFRDKVCSVAYHTIVAMMMSHLLTYHTIVAIMMSPLLSYYTKAAAMMSTKVTSS
jgi:hypothetical protein